MSIIPQVHARRDLRPEGTVAYVTIDNPGRLNALDRDLMDQFLMVLERLAGEDALRCVVLTGAGTGGFVSGVDVDELARIGYSTEARAFIGRVHDCCEAARAFPVPIIARINGVALGAGLELAASCDLRVAVDTARFGMPEVRLGVPSVVEAALLPGLIGWGRAREMMLLGETVDAPAALAMGLVDAVVAPDDLDAAVEKRVAALLAGGQNAIRLQKALMRRWENMPLRDAIQAGADVFAQAYLTDEPAVMIDAWKKARAASKAPAKPAPAAPKTGKPAAKANKLATKARPAQDKSPRRSKSP